MKRYREALTCAEKAEAGAVEVNEECCLEEAVELGLARRCGDVGLANAFQ
jgi:hypothetical protein